RRAVFFNKETFGTDKLVLVSPAETGGGNELTIAKFVGEFPLPEAVRRDVLRLETAAEDFLPGLNSAEKKDRLTRMSYKKFVLDVVKADPRIVPVYQARTHGLFGVGIDAVNALDCWALGLPGFKGLSLEPGPHPRMGYTPRGYASPK